MRNLTTEQRSELGRRLYYERYKKVNPIDEDLMLIARLNNNTLPTGTLQKIATLHSVSRERVRQIADRLGIEPIRETIKKSRICINCQNQINSARSGKFCSATCSRQYRYLKYREAVTCKTCGKSFLSYRYAEQKYCSRNCKGFGSRKYSPKDFTSEFTIRDFIHKYSIENKVIGYNVVHTTLKNWIKNGEVVKFKTGKGNIYKTL